MVRCDDGIPQTELSYNNLSHKHAIKSVIVALHNISKIVGGVTNFQSAL